MIQVENGRFNRKLAMQLVSRPTCDPPGDYKAEYGTSGTPAYQAHNDLWRFHERGLRQTGRVSQIPSLPCPPRA